MSFSTLFTDPQHHHTRVMRLLLLLTFVLLIPACSELYGYECEIDTDCPSLTFCDKGICQPIAQECKEKDYCDGLCVDLDRSDGHCGQCGHACSKESTCCHGKCVPIKKKECNGIDDDCDGYVDKGCPEHPCKKEEEGKTQRCAVSGQKGVCAQGLRTCTNGEWGICKADNVGAKQETCNGLDDDCDGLIDENVKGCVRPFTRPLFVESPASETGLFPIRTFTASPLGVLYLIFENQFFVQKIRRDGYIEKFAGLLTRSSKDGPKDTGGLNNPASIHVSRDGYVYVTERGIHTIRRIDKNGYIETFAGTPGLKGNANGDLKKATFNQPTALIEDSKGALYVVTIAGKMIRKISSRPLPTVSTLVGSVGGNTVSDGPSNIASFQRITHITIDKHDVIYVIDNNRYLRKVTQTGTVSTLAGKLGPGYQDGPLVTAKFGTLAGIAVDLHDNIYLADNYAFGIIRKVDPQGNVSTIAGEPVLVRKTPGFRDGPTKKDGKIEPAILTNIGDIAIDGRNRLYIYDKGNHAIRVLSLTENKVTTLVGIPHQQGRTSRAFEIQPTSPTAMIVHNKEILLTEPKHGLIRSFLFGNNVLTKLFAGSKPGDIDNSLSRSQLTTPHGIQLCPPQSSGALGIIYFSEFNNHKIKSINLNTQRIETVAGSLPGLRHGAAKDAKYRNPSSMLCDKNGNLYIADTGNHIIRVINTQGQDKLLAGTPGKSGHNDGTGSKASFQSPRGMAFDGQGNILVADYGNHIIRKVTLAGDVTTIAGTGRAGHANGPMLKAEFENPVGIAVDSHDNIFIADEGNRVIRKIDAKGNTTTFIGTPKTAGYQTGTTTKVTFQSISGLLWRDGKLYISDADNNVVFVYSP